MTCDYVSTQLHGMHPQHAEIEISNSLIPNSHK